MNRVRSFFAACCAALLCISICAAALGAAVCLTCDRNAAFSTPAMREAVFDHILSGEDPTLVAQLEGISEFVDVQSRYSEQFAAWRYQGGENWTALTDEESSAIARALLTETLTAQDPNYATHDDFDATLEKLIVPLKGALQDVFPSFDLAMRGALRRKMDVAASLIRGTAAAVGLFCTVIFAALLSVTCRNKCARCAHFCMALASAAFFCTIFAISFRTGSLILALPTPLSLLRDLPDLCAWLLLGIALLCAVGACVLFCRGKQCKTQAPAQLQTEQGESIEEERKVSAFENESQAEPITEAPLFTGASSYDTDVPAQINADMDALLAEATGELFGVLADMPADDSCADADFLKDLQSLFDGRVANAQKEN